MANKLSKRAYSVLSFLHSSTRISSEKNEYALRESVFTNMNKLFLEGLGSKNGSLRELMRANERHPEDRRVRKRLGSRLA